jgi:uncharacterized phage protein (TIGR01671 family)
MRTIKFRAWDKDNKQMTVDFAVFADGRGAGAYDPVSSDGDEIYENYELMQFTGLHDKNGKEIYEGDIVEYVGQIKEYHHEVKFKNGCFIAGTSLNNGTIEELNLEVIGNIWENPELIHNI